MELGLLEAVRKGKSGDRQALTEIYCSTNRMVYFNALKLTQNENDAQDIVQETYIKAFQNLSKLQDEKAFIKWLKTIVINLSTNYLKKRKPVLFQTDEQESKVFYNVPEVSEEFLPEEYADKKEKCRLIMDIVDKLPDAQRTAVLLYYFNELPVEEVAQIMETKDGTIKSRLNYARKKIKEEVEEHEKRGIKLYSIPAIPILVRILQNASQEYALPADVSGSILSTSLDSIDCPGGVADEAGVDSSNKTAKAADQQASSPASTKASSSLISKLAAGSLANKVIAGIIAVGLMIGGGLGISHMAGNKESAAESKRKAYVQYEEALGDIEWDDLLGSPKDAIVAMFGEPDEVKEEGKEICYKDKKTGLELFKIVFYEDNTVTFVSGYVPGFSIKGVTVGDTLEQAKAVFDSVPGAIVDEENDNRGSLTAIVYSIGDEYYSFLYDEEEIVQVVSVSMSHIVYTRSPDEEVPAVTEEPAATGEPAEGPFETQEPADPSTSSAEDKPSPLPSEGGDLKNKYKDYFIKHFSGTNAQVFFADLTHDGREEMLVAYGDLVEGYLEVYTLTNGNVALVHDLYTATMTNYRYGIGLYEEDGKDYLLYFGQFERQGFPYYFYDIYRLDDRNELSLHKKEMDFSYDENGQLVGITQKELDQFHQELDSYARKSKLLVSGAHYPGAESSLDVIYGKGEPFRDAAAADKVALDRLILTDDMSILKALGNPVSMKDWEILYDGLAIYKNYGGNDTFHITSGKYSVHGVSVGQSKADALKALEGTRSVKPGNVTGFVFRDPFVSDSFDFAVIPSFSGDAVSELYYQVYFED